MLYVKIESDMAGGLAEREKDQWNIKKNYIQIENLLIYRTQPRNLLIETANICTDTRAHILTSKG